MRLLFVGQAPSRESEGNPPFTGKCGKFLAELMGTTQEQMLLDHDFINVLDHWPGRDLTGDRFPPREARVAAKAKMGQLRGRVVVMLGHGIVRAFGSTQFRYLQWYELRHPDNFADVVSKYVTVVPHPSGVNRYFNKIDNRLIVGKFLGMLIEKFSENTK